MPKVATNSSYDDAYLPLPTCGLWISLAHSVVLTLVRQALPRACQGIGHLHSVAFGRLWARCNLGIDGADAACNFASGTVRY